nr:hypothetical protein [candidate division Zixibacteria bacterium]
MKRMKQFLLTLIIISAVTEAVQAENPTAYVLNTNGETLSKINLTTGTVSNNILTIGTDIFSYPNQLVIRDTLAYAVASGTNEIQVINLRNETTVGFINTGTESNPYWMEFYDDRYLYVTLMKSNSVAKVDYISGSIVDEVEVGKSPEGILIVGNKAYVACTGFDWGTWEYDPGRVAVYDIAGDSVSGYIDVGLNPQYLALDRFGRIHVVCTGDYYTVFGKVYIIDIGTEAVIDSVSVGGTPGQISIGPNNTACIAAAGWEENGYILTYNTETLEIYHNAANPIEVDLNCMMALAYQDSTIFSGSFTNYVKVIDTAGAVKKSYAVGDGPLHAAFNYAPGDVTGDFMVNILDVTSMINWLYKGGPAPRWPEWRANADGNGNYNILDATYLVNYLYRDGPRPKIGPGWLRL